MTGKFKQLGDNYDFKISETLIKERCFNENLEHLRNDVEMEKKIQE